MRSSIKMLIMDVYMKILYKVLNKYNVFYYHQQMLESFHGSGSEMNSLGLYP
jgi:hypothetical protein